MKTAHIQEKGRNVRNGEFSLVCMGALGFPISEKLEAIFSYEEILQMEQENGEAYEISM